MAKCVLIEIPALLLFSSAVGIQWAVLPAGFENLEKNLPICELKPAIIL